MEYFLSDDAYLALIEYAHGRTPDISAEARDYLIEHGYLIIDPPELVVGSGCGLDDIHEVEHEPRISEYGKGFLRAMKEYESRIAEFKVLSESASKTADSAEKIAAVAEKKAARADIKSIVSLIFAFIALVFEFAVNHHKIIGFFSGLIR